MREEIFRVRAQGEVWILSVRKDEIRRVGGPDIAAMMTQRVFH